MCEKHCQEFRWKSGRRCRIRSALIVLYFSAVSCPRLVCRNPQCMRLILDPSSRSDLHCSTCGSFSSTCTNVRGLHLAQVLAPLLLGAVTTVCICYPSRQAATLAQARMSRMVAGAVSARMSNMKRFPSVWWMSAGKRKECPMCGHAMIDIQACHDLCPNCGARLDCFDGP